MLDRSTKENGVEIGNENRFKPRRKIDRKAATLNPGLSIETKKTNRKVGRPKKRWEDDINQFVKPDETEEKRGSDLKNNDTWLKAAKDQQRWKDMEKDYIKNS